MENKEKEMTLEEFSKTARVLLRYLQSLSPFIYLEKEKIVGFFDALAKRAKEFGLKEEADRYEKMARDYRETTRYREELEEALALDQTRMYEQHYAFAYQNLIREYTAEGNPEKINKYEQLLKELKKQDKN